MAKLRMNYHPTSEGMVEALEAKKGKEDVKWCNGRMIHRGSMVEMLSLASLSSGVKGGIRRSSLLEDVSTPRKKARNQTGINMLTQLKSSNYYSLRFFSF